jgi:hypothetical protein
VSQKDAIFVTNGDIEMRLGITDLIENRIIEHGPGWCFTSLNFWDLGSDTAVRKSLSRLQKQKLPTIKAFTLHRVRPTTLPLEKRH